MRFNKVLLLFFAFVFTGIWTPSGLDAASETKAPAGTNKLSLDEIIDRVEAHYAVSGFTALFFQTSTIKAMDITDTASGRIFVKRPGKMRWEYQKPEPQTIVSDGKQLWIFRPEDRQVMIGKAPDFFGGGKGASFLSDMRQIRSQFLMNLGGTDPNGDFQLNLLPIEKKFDISLLTLTVSAKTFDIIRIITYNSYGDETRIELSDIQLKSELDDRLFTFSTPEGVEVLYLDE